MCLDGGHSLPNQLATKILKKCIFLAQFLDVKDACCSAIYSKGEKRKKEEMKCDLIDLGYIHTTQRRVVITDAGPAQPLGDILMILDGKKRGGGCVQINH